jgi:hypothetical protein
MLYLRGIPLEYFLRESKEKRGTSSPQNKEHGLRGYYSVTHDRKHLFSVNTERRSKADGLIAIPSLQQQFAYAHLCYHVFV